MVSNDPVIAALLERRAPYASSVQNGFPIVDNVYWDDPSPMVRGLFLMQLQKAKAQTGVAGLDLRPPARASRKRHVGRSRLGGSTIAGPTPGLLQTLGCAIYPMEALEDGDLLSKDKMLAGEFPDSLPAYNDDGSDDEETADRTEAG